MVFWKKGGLVAKNNELKKQKQQNRSMMKQGGLFCFVLSWWRLPNHDASCCGLGIFEKLSTSREWCTDLVWDCLELLRCGSYLNIEAFSQWKLNKIKTENCVLELGSVLGKLLESPWWVRFNRVYISQFSELRCGRYWFLSGFCCWKFKQIAKTYVLEGKKKIQCWKCEK